MISKDGGNTWGMTSFPANFYTTAIIFGDNGELIVSARSNAFDKNKG